MGKLFIKIGHGGRGAVNFTEKTLHEVYNL